MTGNTGDFILSPINKKQPRWKKTTHTWMRAKTGSC